MAMWELSPFASQLWHSSFESLPKGQLSVQLSKPHPIWNSSVERGYRSQPEEMRESQHPEHMERLLHCPHVLPWQRTKDRASPVSGDHLSTMEKCSGRGSPVFLQLKRLFLSLEFLAFVRSQHQCWSGTGNLLLQHLIIPPIKLSEVI